jgi:outer membrane protein assembly factor BamB
MGGAAVEPGWQLPIGEFVLRSQMILRFAALCILAAELGAAEWPQWRGPDRDGQVRGAPWPADLKPGHLDRQWRLPLGPSYSGPIVAADRVFTTESKDKESEVVHAFDRATGQPLWRQEWTGAMKVPFFARSNGDWIRSTPAYDGETLFVAGMRDVLVALEARTGAVRWRKDFVAELKTPVPAFGNVSSPLVAGEALYVQSAGAVVRLDKRTGQVIWRALGSDDAMNGSPFSSPVLATLAGRRQLVAQTRTDLAGLDPETGAVLWSQGIEAFRGMNILTPVVVGERIFTSAYGGKTRAFELQPRGPNGFTLKETWQFKAQGYMSTPVWVGGHAYLHLRNQRVLCLDLASGAERWTTPDGFGKYWSLVANGNHLLALDERGELLLFRANTDKFDLVDRRKISESDTWAHVAPAGDQLFIRELDGLSAWKWHDPAGK